MSVGLFFVFLIVMLFSFAIAATARQATLSDDPEVFLFGGNSSLLAISSNIGALLSVSIVFSLFAVGMAGYGFATLFSTVAGISAAYLTFYLARHKLARNAVPNKPDHLLTTHLQEKEQALINPLIIAQYLVALVCEFAVFQSFLRGVESDFPSFALLSSLMVACICAAYIVVGGYYGVLKTDVFQIFIFVGACLMFVPLIVSPTGPIVEAVYNPRFWQWPPWIGPVTWFSFTYATFLAFPDVWIRNFGTLSKAKFSGGWFIPLSFVLLLTALVPILALACFGAEGIGLFDRRYDVQRSYEFFINSFLSSSMHDLGKWVIAAAFVCVFVTTIDTWLIGVLQYSKNIRRLKGFGPASGLLFGTSIAVVLVSHFMSGRMVYLVGLFLFPFIFLNMLLFFGKLRREWSDVGSGWRYFAGWAGGAATTLIMIIANWDQKEDFAPHIIFVAMITQVTVFVVYPLLARLRKTI